MTVVEQRRREQGGAWSSLGMAGFRRKSLPESASWCVRLRIVSFLDTGLHGAQTDLRLTAVKDDLVFLILLPCHAWFLCYWGLNPELHSLNIR